MHLINYRRITVISYTKIRKNIKFKLHVTSQLERRQIQSLQKAYLEYASNKSSQQLSAEKVSKIRRHYLSGEDRAVDSG